MRPLPALLFLLAAGSTLAVAETAAPPPAAPQKIPDGLYADIVTPRGTITAELFYTKAPLTVTNFVGLAEGLLGPKKGAPFFNGLKFHRVVPNFVVQGGDPLGTGEGDPGYSFPDEFVPGLRHDATGILSMANSGPDTNGSQFFITLREVNRLNYLHSVFGRVIHGLEVLPLIQKDDVITAVVIRRIGTAAEAFPDDQAAFDRLAAAAKRAVVPLFDDPEQLLPTEPPRARAFSTKLANYDRATGMKIYARVFSKFTPEKPNQKPGSLAGSLAKQLKLPPTAELALLQMHGDRLFNALPEGRRVRLDETRLRLLPLDAADAMRDALGRIAERIRDYSDETEALARQAERQALALEAILSPDHEETVVWSERDTRGGVELLAAPTSFGDRKSVV